MNSDLSSDEDNVGVMVVIWEENTTRRVDILHHKRASQVLLR